MSAPPRTSATLTGAPVSRGGSISSSVSSSGQSDNWAEVLAAWFTQNGVPAGVTDELIEQGSYYRPSSASSRPRARRRGDSLDGWDVVEAPGHADGQLTLLKDGVLVAADHLLARISPTVGLWPASRPDPLGDYLAPSRRTSRSRRVIALRRSR